jgi:hypothetical protein
MPLDRVVNTRNGVKGEWATLRKGDGAIGRNGGWRHFCTLPRGGQRIRPFPRRRKKSRQPRINSRLPDLYFLVGYYNGSEPLWTHEWLLGGREGGGRRVCRSTAGIEAPDKDVIACIGNQVCERKAGFRRFCNIALHNVEQGTGMI